MFCDEMIELFHKIHVALPKPGDYMKKHTFLLTDIGGKWFMDKNKSKLSAMKILRLSKEAQKS